MSEKDLDPNSADKEIKIIQLADLFLVTGVPGAGKSFLMNKFNSDCSFRSRMFIIDLDNYGYWIRSNPDDLESEMTFKLDFDPDITNFYKEQAWNYDVIVLFGIFDNMNDVLLNNYFTGLVNVNTPSDTIVDRLRARVDKYASIASTDKGAANFLKRVSNEEGMLEKFVPDQIAEYDLHNEKFYQTTSVDELERYIIANSPMMSKYIRSIRADRPDGGQ